MSRFTLRSDTFVDLYLYVFFQVLDNVRTVLRFWRYEGDGKWEEKTNAAGEAGGGGEGDAVAVGEDVSVSAINPDVDDGMWLWRDGYLVPDCLELADAADGCSETELLKSKPGMFDTEGMVVEQFFADSLDGTKVRGVCVLVCVQLVCSRLKQYVHTCMNE